MDLEKEIVIQNILLASGRKIKHLHDLKGLIPLRIDVSNGDQELHIYFTENVFARLYHAQDCCEDVYIESIVGDLNDLIGTQLLITNESSQNTSADESQTWTFYKFATIKGYVDIRWYGTSNGFYSESVNFQFVDPKNEFG